MAGLKVSPDTPAVKGSAKRQKVLVNPKKARKADNTGTLVKPLSKYTSKKANAPSLSPSPDDEVPKLAVSPNVKKVKHVQKRKVDDMDSHHLVSKTRKRKLTVKISSGNADTDVAKAKTGKPKKVESARIKHEKSFPIVPVDPRTENDKHSVKKQSKDLRTVARKMIVAMKKYFDELHKDEIQVLAPRTNLFLEFTLDQAPRRCDTHRTVVKLTHPTRTDETACLITDAPQRQWKDKLAKEQETLPMITRVIDSEKLMKKYPTTRDRLDLLRSYDSFFVHDAPLVKVVGFLGQPFKRSWKMPSRVRLREELSVAEVFLPVYQASTIFIHGATNTVRLGLLERNEDELADNVISALQNIQKHLEQNHETCKIWEVKLVAGPLHVILVAGERKVVIADHGEPQVDSESSFSSEE